MEIVTIRQFNSLNEEFSRDRITNFLHTHLEQYRDSKKDIVKAIDYAVDPTTQGNGFILVGHENGEMLAAVVINETGMSGYIPENILVYIAVHHSQRGKGVGKKIMQEAIELANGNIALHVEKDNPARFLYERLGFTNPYLEMRLNKH